MSACLGPHDSGLGFRTGLVCLVRLLGSLKWPARVPLLSCLLVGGSQLALVSLAHTIQWFPLAVTSSHSLLQLNVGI